MNNKISRTYSKVLWVAFSLALITAIAYVLIALGGLPIGNYQDSGEGASIVFVAAGCYLLGGALILAKRRWLWIIGILINALVMTFFFSMYQARPDVIFSAGGLSTKISQLLLEVSLLYLLIRSWVKKV